MFETEFKSSLRDLVQRVQKESYEWTWADLSRASDLSAGTCKKLTEGKTKSPHYRTVLKIAKAIGIDIAFEKTEKPVLRLVGRKAAKKVKKTKTRLKKVS